MKKTNDAVRAAVEAQQKAIAEGQANAKDLAANLIIPSTLEINNAYVQMYPAGGVARITQSSSP